MADIEHLIRIEARPQAVFPLVGTGDGFRGWWAEDVTTDPGGTVSLGFFDRATIYELSLDRADALRAASWRVNTGKEWAGTHIRFALTPSGDATVLEFAHAGWAAPTEYFRMCNTTWGELMYRLKAAAEGHKPGPLFLKSTLAY